MISFTLLLLLFSLSFAYVAASCSERFCGSSCLVQLQTGFSTLNFGSSIDAELNCTVDNTNGNASLFLLVVTASQLVPSDVLSFGCGAGVSECRKPVLNATSTSTSQVEWEPLDKYAFEETEAVIAVFSGDISEDVTLQATANLQLFVGNLFVNPSTNVSILASVRDPEKPTQPKGTSNPLDVFVDSVPTLLSLSTFNEDVYLAIGERDSIDFTLDQFVSDYSVSLEIYSNYRLNIYDLRLDNLDRRSSLTNESLTSTGSLNVPCLSDLCFSEVDGVTYRYLLDLAGVCCNQGASHSFQINYHIWETPGQGDDVYVSAYLRLQTTGTPLFVAIRNALTFATNPGIEITKSVKLLSDDPLPQVYQVQIDVINRSPYRLRSFTLNDDISQLNVFDNINFDTSFGPWTRNSDSSTLAVSGGTILPEETHLNFSYDVSVYGDGSGFPTDKQWRPVTVEFVLLDQRSSYNNYYGKEFVLSPECPACFMTSDLEVLHTEVKYYWFALGIIFFFTLGFLVMLLVIFILIHCFGFSSVVTVLPVNIQSSEESSEERERRLRKELRDRKRSEREKRHMLRRDQNSKDIKQKQVSSKTLPGLVMGKMKAYLMGSRQAFDYALTALTSMIQEDYTNCTVVQLAAVDDAVKTEKEIACVDIAESIEFDKSCERTREHLLLLLIRSILIAEAEAVAKESEGNDANKDVLLRLAKKIEIDIGDAKSKVDNAFKLEADKMMKKLRLNHEKQILRLRVKQLKERKPLSHLLKKESKMERHNLLEALDRQHRKELDELAHVLQLERFEQMESSRRIKAADLRLQVKQLINEALVSQKAELALKSETNSIGSSDTPDIAALDLETRLDSIRVQFQSAVDILEKCLDSHVADVKCKMEEKTAWRRHFVTLKEVASDRQRGALNVIRDQMKQFLETQISLGRIDEVEESRWMMRLRGDIMAIKAAMLSEKQHQLTQLDKVKVSEYIAEKSARSVEMGDIHKQFDEVAKEKLISGEIDAQEFIQSRFRVSTESTLKWLDREMQFDIECSNQVIQIIAAIFDKVYAALEQTSGSYTKELQKTGCDPEEGVALVEQFERDKEKMKLTLQEELEQLKMAYQKQLNKKSKKWKLRRIEERSEQEKLRQHEQRIIRALVDEQLSSVTSDDLNSSNQLLQQREQLLASIESNITVQKLKSQRQLEEMLYRRAEKKVDKVVAEQLQEIEARELRKSFETEDMSDVDFVRSLIQERSQRTAAGATSVPKKRINEMLLKIEEQMVKERLEGVKTQEEKLAKFLAAQQLQSARKLATIEAHHDRLVTLKMCLLTQVGHQHSLATASALAALEAQSPATKLIKEFEEIRKKIDEQIEEEKTRQNDLLQHKIDKMTSTKQAWLDVYN
ncbi:uncharacterized protein LOC142337613 isoform X2 [Convolutriloba macropyga]|uniref:uncharacterized protein LOC142337613 isoform X2 n=1 Tax=Convolutriloba macropyga TaxID=536237 RepID=UPI003F527C81